MSGPKQSLEKARYSDVQRSIEYLSPKPESKRRIRRRLKALQRKKTSINKTIEALSRK